MLVHSRLIFLVLLLAALVQVDPPVLAGESGVDWHDVQGAKPAVTVFDPNREAEAVVVGAEKMKLI